MVGLCSDLIRFYTIFSGLSVSQFKVCMRGSRKFGQRGSFDGFFYVCVLVDEGREGPNTTISGSSLTRQENAI